MTILLLLLLMFQTGIEIDFTNLFQNTMPQNLAKHLENCLGALPNLVNCQDLVAE